MEMEHLVGERERMEHLVGERERMEHLVGEREEGRIKKGKKKWTREGQRKKRQLEQYKRCSEEHCTGTHHILLSRRHLGHDAWVLGCELTKPVELLTDGAVDNMYSCDPIGQGHVTIYGAEL